MSEKLDIRRDFEIWAASKDFFDTLRPYPYDCYIRAEMQIAWIAWRDSYREYYNE